MDDKTLNTMCYVRMAANAQRAGMGDVAEESACV